MKTWALAAWLSIAGMAYAQDKPEKPAPKPDAPKPEAQEEELTPEKAMAMLKEVQGLMTKAEELLNDSSRGKAVESEEETLKRIRELLKNDPKDKQQKALELIAKLMQKSEGSQKDAIEGINEVIKKAKAAGGS